MEKQSKLINSILGILLITGSASIISCDPTNFDEQATEVNESLNTPYGTREANTPVKGIFFENGKTSETSNNMLHFSSHEEYEHMLSYLEYLVDKHEDDFISEYDHLNEDELNDLEEAIKFNEDLPLDMFETEHKFTSLRKITTIAEDQWLDTSDQPGFSWDDDPDDLPFIDGIERTLYNPWHEVMVNDTIYKFTENGFYTIPANNLKASLALSYINNNPEIDPLKIENEYENTVYYTSDSNEYNETSDCIQGRKKRTKRYVNGDYRIKARQKMKRGPLNITYKTVIKNYKKKGSKWKKRRIKSYTGIEGYIQDLFLPACNYLDYLNVENNRCTYKKRRRGEYAKRYRYWNINAPYRNERPGVKKYNYWTVYKQKDWVIYWELEE